MEQNNQRPRDNVNHPLILALLQVFLMGPLYLAGWYLMSYFGADFDLKMGSTLIWFSLMNMIFIKNLT